MGFEEERIVIPAADRIQFYVDENLHDGLSETEGNDEQPSMRW
jgi:hypothetical protein